MLTKVLGVLLVGEVSLLVISGISTGGDGELLI